MFTCFDGIVIFLIGTVLPFAAGTLEDQYIGCFSDPEGQSNWTHGLTSSNNLTIEICISSCKSKDTTYAILQIGKECRCGNIFRTYLSNDSFCNVSCSGNQPQYCDGLSSVTPYSAFYAVCPIGYYGSNCDKVCHCEGQISCNLINGQCPNGCEGNWTGSTCNGGNSYSGRYVGCYNDTRNRALPNEVPQDLTDNTTEKCLSICTSNGTSYAGLQYSIGCFCGETYDKYGKLSENSCYRTCTGNQSQICGGEYANSIYSVCATGTFGRDCVDHCYCKESGRCNFTGSCPTGCKPGWTGNNCNVRDCSVVNGDCSGNQTCMNIDLKYSSVAQCRCSNGYSKDTLWTNCIDNDECVATPSVCNETTAICNNTIGSFVCICKTGFRRNDNSAQCEDIDECQVVRCNSSAEQCMNTFGSFKCICKGGYERTDGINCVDIDECQRDICDNSTTLCNNTVGAFECRCREGLVAISKTTCGTERPGNVSTIVGAVVGSIGGLLIILFIIGIVLFYRRRSRHQKDTEIHPDSTNVVSESPPERQDKVVENSEPMYDKISHTTSSDSNQNEHTYTALQ